VSKSVDGWTDTDGDGVLSPGDTVRYTVAWSNSGNVPLTGATLVDDPDEAWVADVTGDGAWDGDTVSWSLGTLAAGESGSETYDVLLREAGAFPDGATDVDNTVVLSATGADPATDAARVTVSATASPTLTKSATGFVDTDGNGVLSPGDGVTYEVTVTNDGNAPVDGALLVDDPDEAAFADVDDDGWDGARIVWELGTLEPGASETFTYTATLHGAGVFGPGETDAVNTVTLTADGRAPLTDAVTVTVTAGNALRLAKSVTGWDDTDGDGALSPGDTVHYALVAANDGNAPATGVTLTDVPDAGRFVSSTATGWDGTRGAWDLGTLDPGEEATFAYDAVLAGAGAFPDGSTEVGNVATLSAADASPVTDDATVTVSADAVLVVVESVTWYEDLDGSGGLSPGDEVYYEITYTNTGNATATASSLTVDPDETWVVAVEVEDGGAYDGDLVTWDLGDLAPGETGVVGYAAVLAGPGTFPPGLTPVDDLATLSSDQTAPVTDPEAILVAAGAELGVTKEVAASESLTADVENSVTVYAGGSAGPGASVASSIVTATRLTWTVTVWNEGDAAAPDVKVEDTLPDGMVFESASDGGTAAGGVVTWDLGELSPGEHVSLTVAARTE
jgi:uncharacterized repeat protein (TIGR01451 family)